MAEIHTVMKSGPTFLHVTLIDHAQQHIQSFMSTKYLVIVNVALHPSEMQTLREHHNLSIKLHTVKKCDRTYMP